MTSQDQRDQTIFRVACRDQSFTAIGNSILQDWALPLDVRGFLACILSLPQNWSFRAGWFFTKNGCGKDRGYRILKHLIDAGYAQRSAHRRANGTIAGWSYVFTDKPGDFGSGGDQLPVFQEVDGWPIKRAPKSPDEPLPDLPLLAQPDLGQPVLANGSLQKKHLHKPITETKKSSARGRARRPSRSQFEKQEDGSMALTPSPDALARGLKIAAGWDKAFLLEEFRSMNEDVEVRNVDAAWLGFCRHQGENPDRPKFKASGKAVAMKPAPEGTVPIVRLGTEWAYWLEHLDKYDPPVAAQMRSSRTFMAYVPTKLPASEHDRPRFPEAADA